MCVLNIVRRLLARSRGTCQYPEVALATCFAVLAWPLLLTVVAICHLVFSCSTSLCQCNSAVPNIKYNCTIIFCDKCFSHLCMLQNIFLIHHHCKTPQIRQKLLMFLQGVSSGKVVFFIIESYFCIAMSIM